MNSPVRFMAKKDFAAFRGVGKSAVSNWVKKGWVVEAEDPADGVIKVDVVRTEAKLNANLDPGRGRPAVQPELPISDAAPRAASERGGGLGEVRSDLMRTQIASNLLKNAKSAGELVLLEDFARRASEYGRAALDRSLSIVRSQAEWLVAAKDARSIVAHMEDEIYRAFEDLAAQIASGAAIDPGEPEDETVADAEAALVAAAEQEELQEVG